jgi:hypothetical protein
MANDDTPDPSDPLDPVREVTGKLYQLATVAATFPPESKEAFFALAQAAWRIAQKQVTALAGVTDMAKLEEKH